MTYEIVRTAQGRSEVIDVGPRTKMLDRLRQLRRSTRRGVSGRGGKKYAITYAPRQQASP
jgi:hypothetical protein